jgi:methionine-rich copper-binding protein CopC
MHCIRLLAILAVLATGTTVVRAHAHLDHASPAAGGTVRTAPKQVSITFTENLEAAFSTIEVSDAAGTRVDDNKPQLHGKVMQIGLQTLAPGAYRVKWHAVSVDSHTTDGTFSFEVKP